MEVDASPSSAPELDEIEKRRAYKRAYREKNRERLNEQARLQRLKHAETNRERDRTRLAAMSEEEKKRRAEVKKQWRERNLDEVRAKQREYYHNNIEARTQYRRAYEEENAEIIRERKLARYAENVEENREYHRKWRAEHPESVREAAERYTTTHKDRLRHLQTKWREEHSDERRTYEKLRYDRIRTEKLEVMCEKHLKDRMLRQCWEDTSVQPLDNGVSISPRALAQPSDEDDTPCPTHLDALVGEAKLVPYAFPKYTSGKTMLVNLCRQLSQNDVSAVQYHESGEKFEKEDKVRKAVNVMSADNFLLVAHVKDTEIARGQYLKYNAVQAIIYAWLKAHDIRIVDVKPLQFNMDSKRTYGKDRNQPHATYKVATADEDLEKLLGVLSNRDAMKYLESQDIFFYNIDIKCDYAACLTPQVRSCAVDLASVHLPNFDMILLENEKDVGKDCVTLLSTDGNLRAKAYNKFVESIENPGVKKVIGDHVTRWADNTGANLKTAILDPDTQSHGLTRIEFTLARSVPTFQRCVELMTKFEKVFLKHCNKTPIREQWAALSAQLRHTVVVYDCYTGQYALSRWVNKRTGKINGILGRERSLLQLEHKVKLCSFYDLPIDIYFVTSRVKSKDAEVDTLMGFQAFEKSYQVEVKGVLRTHWQLHHVRVFRGIGYDKTHFLKNDTLYSSALTHPNLAATGLISIAHLKPSVSEHRFRTTDKLEHIPLLLNDPQREAVVEQKAETVNVIDGFPPNGQYQFVSSRKYRLSLPGHRKSDDVLCVLLSDGNVYACYGNWKKLVPLFQKQESFSFYVFDDNNVSLLDAGKRTFPCMKPMPLLKLMTDRVYTVAQTELKHYYGKQRTLVQFVELPTIAFLATDEFEAQLATHSMFRTIGPGHNDQRKKVMLLRPE